MASKFAHIVFCICTLLTFGEAETDDGNGTAQFSGDNFANNLFTDVTPLLALFGEQFALQFLSECYNWKDHALFAMAPIGVITGIICAIRVGGSDLLRATIGRARESIAEPEREFMSSMSKETREVWDGEAIVRTGGASSVKQIIHLPANFGDISPASFVTLESDIQDHDHKLECHQRCDIDTDPENYDKLGLSTISDLPPNISLNCQETIPSWESWAYALLATIFQLGVIAWSGVICLSPRWKKLLPSFRPVPGFCLLVVGTLLLTISMWMCAQVVDQGTVERRWVKVVRCRSFMTMPKPSLQQDFEGSNPPTGSRNDKSDSSEDVQDSVPPTSGAQFHSTSTPQNKSSAIKSPLQNKLNIYWVQTSGEEGFGSFILQKHDRETVITSHRSPELRGERKQEELANTNNGHRQSTLSLKNKTTAAVGLGVVGFFVQFESLRLINWSCSIAQLIALGLATFLRGLARRKMVGQPKPRAVHPGHEMDGLAFDIARHQLKDQKLTFEFTTDFAYSIQSKKADTDAQKVLEMRMRFAHITKWRGPKNEEALCLKNAIELTIQKLKPDLDDLCSNNAAWVWLRVCTRKGNKNLGNDSISFELRKPQSNATSSQDKWTVNALQLEAALSLAEYTLIEKNTQGYTDAEDARVPDYFQVLGPSEDFLHFDLVWWTDLTHEALKKGFTSTERVHPNDPQLRLGFRGFRAKPSASKGLGIAISRESSNESDVQQLPNKLESQMERATNMYAAIETPLPRFSKRKASQSTPNETALDGGSNRYTIQITSDKIVSLKLPNVQALAIHLFSAFIWSIVPRVRVPKYTSSSSVSALPDAYAELYVRGKVWHTGRFRCQEIEDIVTEVQNLGLGVRNRMAILLSIIAPMSIVDSLPNETYIEGLLKFTLGYEQTSSWAELFQHYQTLLEVVQIRGKQDRFARRAVAATLELIARVIEVPIQEKDWGSFHRTKFNNLLGFREMGALVKKEEFVLGILKWLGTIYKEQPRSSRYEKAVTVLLGSPSHEYLKEVESAPEEEQWRYLGSTDVLGRSEAHCKLFDWVRERVPEKVPGRRKRNSQFQSGDNSVDNANVRDILQPCLGEVCDITGQTTLHQLVNDLPSKQFGSFLDFIQQLDEKDAVPWTNASSKTGRNGQTPLHRAAVTGNIRAAKFLLSRSAEANAKDNVGRTPLMIAACHSASLSICMELLLRKSNKDDVNLQDENNETALHMAARHGQKEIVTFLLKQTEIDPKLLDGPSNSLNPTDRLTPQQRAMAAGYGDIAELIHQEIQIRKTSIRKDVSKHFASYCGVSGISQERILGSAPHFFDHFEEKS